jgi:hypothetical protein
MSVWPHNCIGSAVVTNLILNHRSRDTEPGDEVRICADHDENADEWQDETYNMGMILLTGPAVKFFYSMNEDRTWEYFDLYLPTIE